MFLKRTRRRTSVVGIALAMTAGLLAVPLPATAEETPSLDASVSATMLAQRGAAAQRDFGVTALPPPLVEPTRSAATWVFGAVTIPAPATDHVAPLSALFLARLDPAGWEVGLDGTADFVALAQQAPETVVSPSERQLFARNYQAARSDPTDTGLGLPWPVNTAWSMGGGPHGNGGNTKPFSSIDFNGGDGKVLAPGPGKVYKSCVKERSALVKVVHANGFTTTYYHMLNLTELPDGSDIEVGTYLGKTATELPCGGSASGAHVHFSLLKGDQHVGVQDMKIGGWVFNEGSSAYGGFAERDGQKVSRGGRLTNYGPGGSTG